MKISVVVITFNEARNISRCLQSVAKIADEVVVVDSFSTDDTVRICQQFGARVLQNQFIDFSTQKNFANARANNDWILSLDADEALSPELLESLKKWKSESPVFLAYKMNRLTNYCGQWIRYCGWYPDTKIRLFNRNCAQWGGSNPHESLQIEHNSKIGFLAGDLHHYSYYTVEEHRQRAKKYAEMAAEFKFKNGEKAFLLKEAFSPLFKFFRNYVLKFGFLDGRAGLTICYLSACETYWKYQHLRQLRSFANHSK